jgi:hypothetical protein
VFGVTLRWGGVCEGWAYLSDTARERPVALSKIARQALRQLHQEGVWRVQIAVSTDFPRAGEWAQRILGFACEGLMRAYGPDGGDYWLMAKVEGL